MNIQNRSEFLPVENLSLDAAVVKSGLPKLDFMNAHIKGAHFAVVAEPSEATDGLDFVYPAWQFVDPVPQYLPEIIKLFADYNTTHPKQKAEPNTFIVPEKAELNTFLVTANEILNDLAPAEMIAGRYFEEVAERFHAQDRYLNLPDDQRFAKVKFVAELWLQENTA